jgi:hypothetical protein
LLVRVQPGSRADLQKSSSSPVQSGARRDGIAGIYGNVGTVDSATYRI